jgi:hypothetical protein
MLAIKGSWGAADLAAFIRCYHGTYVKLLRLKQILGWESGAVALLAALGPAGWLVAGIVGIGTAGAG